MYFFFFFISTCSVRPVFSVGASHRGLDHASFTELALKKRKMRVHFYHTDGQLSSALRVCNWVRMRFRIRQYINVHFTHHDLNYRFASENNKQGRIKISVNEVELNNSARSNGMLFLLLN